MTNEIAEPTRVEEIQGGRYDGDFRVDATCPHCGGAVTHILNPGEHSSHRVVDCVECRGTGEPKSYSVVRPKPALLPSFWWNWWKGTPQDAMGFPLPEGHPNRDTKPRGPGLLGRFLGRDD